MKFFILVLSDCLFSLNDMRELVMLLDEGSTEIDRKRINEIYRKYRLREVRDQNFLVPAPVLVASFSIDHGLSPNPVPTIVPVELHFLVPAPATRIGIGVDLHTSSIY